MTKSRLALSLALALFAGIWPATAKAKIIDPFTTVCNKQGKYDFPVTIFKVVTNPSLDAQRPDPAFYVFMAEDDGKVKMDGNLPHWAISISPGGLFPNQKTAAARFRMLNDSLTKYGGNMIIYKRDGKLLGQLLIPIHLSDTPTCLPIPIESLQPYQVPPEYPF